MRMFPAAMCCLWVGQVAAAPAAPPVVQPAPRAVLLELFTAEGCSSCPVADEFAVQLDAVQPIPGARVVVLSEHVNYWDRDWPDPHSSAQLTERQNAYIHARGLREPYTPQLIVDGSAEIHLQDRARVAQILQGAAAAAKLGVRISTVAIDAATRMVVEGHIAVDASNDEADVFAALALDHVQSKVLRGENRGRTLTHVGVVLDLVKLGSLTPGRPFEQDFKLPLRSPGDARNLRVVGFAQAPGFGKVSGVAVASSASTPSTPAS